MEKDKSKDNQQKKKEIEDDKPDYQEKITFLVSTVAQAFILTWCLLVLSLGYIKLPNKLFGMDIPDQPRVDSTFAAGLLGNILGGLGISVNAAQGAKKKKKEGVNERDNVAMAYKRTLSNKVELKKLKDAIEMFQKKIKKQGMATNARDEDHLANLIKVYKDMGGKGVRESVNEGRVLHFTQIKDKTLEKHLKVISKKVGATVSKISGGFKVDADNDGRKLAQVVDYIFDKSLMKGLMSGGGMSKVQLVNEDSGSVIDEGLGDMVGKSIGKYNKKRKKNMDALKKLKKKESVEEARGTCWVGYQQVGMKKKGGKMVPNCVKEIYYEENGKGYGYTFEFGAIEEAEYQGRKVKLNKIMQGDKKKFKVYVKNPKGNVVKVNFGQGGDAKGGTMRIRKSNPGARKSFRARHNCDNPGPKTKARYWSCKAW